MPLLSSATLMTASASFSAMLGAKSVHTEINIPASPDKVWEVLVDVENYPVWNPVFTLVEGKLEEGAKVTYLVQESEEKSAKIPAKVITYLPHKLLNQTGGYWGILTFDHTYRLEPINIGTRVIIHEDYTGVWVNFWDPSSVEEQYKKLAVSLKKRVIEIN
ncbi:SRPBCC domain-containing protein [Photobacterium sp. OFAV2-7]|uniref:SRPBCC domain-containing protein n=1 Tax=Photobacterium sp. OFAV2-7 TaxID=2917748 RepID=UPI001EF5B54E|nr:SRPBCC domain-containing protein [Photobacterium sp. OFAV2-7]MCG7587232.1 SRPBCC domain-containing protein [Photobacterium sp. OFAV2-7]